MVFAGDIALEDDGVLGRMNLDLVARGDLLEPLLEQHEVALHDDVEEDGLRRVERHERRGAHRLAVDEDLVRRDHEDVGDGRVRHRDTPERLLEVEHL
jgi:hypothetical protein